MPKDSVLSRLKFPLPLTSVQEFSLFAALWNQLGNFKKNASVLSLPTRDCDLIGLRFNLSEIYIKHFNYRRTSFYHARLCGASQLLGFYRWKVWGNPAWVPVFRQHVLPSYLCHSPVILTASKTFPLLYFYGDLCRVMADGTSVTVWGHRRRHHVTRQT